MPEMAREYTRIGGQMETAKKQRTTRINPRWCSPNDADKDYKVMELLRPAVLGCCDSLGVHWSGAWSHSVRPGSRPEASHGWRVHAYRRGDGTGWGQPGLAGKTKCVVPSVGKSDRAAREVFFFFFLFFGKKPCMSANLANDSNTSRQIKGNL